MRTITATKTPLITGDDLEQWFEDFCDWYQERYGNPPIAYRAFKTDDTEDVPGLEFTFDNNTWLDENKLIEVAQKSVIDPLFINFTIAYPFDPPIAYRVFRNDGAIGMQFTFDNDEWLYDDDLDYKFSDYIKGELGDSATINNLLNDTAQNIEEQMPYSLLSDASDTTDRWSIVAPNDVCFAANYNSITVTRDDDDTLPRKLKIVASDSSNNSKTYSVNPYLYGKETEIPISNVLKQMVSIPDNLSSNVDITIIDETSTVTVLTFSLCVICGSLNVGQRFANIGKYDNASHAFVRNITWFKNYPSKYSYFRRSGQIDETYIDDASQAVAGGNVKTTGIYTEVLDGEMIGHPVREYAAIMLYGTYNRVWDDEYDYTYGDNLSDNPDTTIIVFNVCDRKDGVFLRWIDNRGLWYSYLFDIKEEATDTDSDDIQITKHYISAGMQFSGEYPIAKTSTKKIVCSAQQLNKEAFDDIATIASSLYVEMYRCGEFYRVNVTPKSVVKTHKKELNEIEIEILTDQNKHTI